GALNFDFVFSEEGELYFLELGPRNGGCLIPEVIRYATGVDLIKATVDAALGIDCSYLVTEKVKGYWSSYMVHALEGGCFKELMMSDRILSHVVESDIWVKPGEKVRRYSGSNDTLGTMILKYPNMIEMLETLGNMERDVRVVIK